MNRVVDVGSGELITEKHNSEILSFVKDFFNRILSYAQTWFKLFITSFNSHNKLDFLILFYLGYISGIALLRIAEVLEKGRTMGLSFFYSFYFPYICLVL